MIEIKNMSFSYGERPVLQSVNFRAEPGQLVAVLGPNGVGKSTLFRCMLGLLRNYEGEILIENSEVRTLKRRELARLAAYIPQSSDPVFNYTVMDMVLMGTTGSLNPLSRPGTEQMQRAERALEILGISELADRGVGRISGGERQLTMIARALAQNARMLIMDEPTANLDYGNQFLVLDRIRSLTRNGYTVLISTHNPDHALRFSSNVLILRRGQDCISGPTGATLTAECLKEIYNLPVQINDIALPNETVKTCTPI